MINKLNFEFTADAENDLIHIRQFTLENWGGLQSNKYIMELNETINLLCNNPDIGVECKDIMTESYRFPSKSHVIYYQILKNRLIIFAVLHKNMVPQSHLSKRKIIE